MNSKRKGWLFICLGLGLIIIASILLTMPKKTEGKFTTISVNNKTYKAEVADSEASQVHGLSDRPTMPKDQVMLFAFDKTDTWGIWMKDMHFSLDILWLNENKQVITFYTNVSPATYPDTFAPTSPAKYVIEANPGFAQANNIATGTTFTF